LSGGQSQIPDVDVRDVAANAEASRVRQRSLVAGVVGNFVEFFDWTIYAYMAPVFAAQIFPAHDPTISLLLAFSTFGLGYIARPLGAVIFGIYGDRLGRRNALTLTILLMAGGSAVVACAPTYASAGLVSPALVLLARLIQGFAAGGEGGSAQAYMTELGRSGRRGFTASLQQVSTGISTLCALALSAFLTHELSAAQMASIGWRVPFLLGAALGGAGLYLRRRATESDAFLSHRGDKPVVKTLLREWRSLVLVTAIALFPSTVYFTWQLYLPTYITATTALARDTALSISTIGLLCYVMLVPPSAILSDRLGRKPMMIGYTVAALLWGYPTFIGLPSFAGSFIGVLIVAVVGNAILAVMSGSLVACMAEQFNTSVRATGAGFSYAVAVVISGGSFPTIVTALLVRKHFGSILIYFSLIGLVSLLACILMPETRLRRIED
jgi:MFS transporter, MHS family, alpha-ketoglutarate permease